MDGVYISSSGFAASKLMCDYFIMVFVYRCVLMSYTRVRRTNARNEYLRSSPLVRGSCGVTILCRSNFGGGGNGIKKTKNKLETKVNRVLRGLRLHYANNNNTREYEFGSHEAL